MMNVVPAIIADHGAQAGQSTRVPVRAKLQNLGLHAAVYWIVVAAFVLRLLARIIQGVDIFWTNGYVFFFEMAQSIAAGKGFATADGIPTSFRTPLYPIVLAALTFGHKWFWPVAVFQSLIGAGTTLCAALLARQMYKGRLGQKAAVLAAGITAAYPYYVVHDTAMQETSLFTLLTLVALIVAQRIMRIGGLWPAVLCGLLLGLDVLTRSPIALFALLVPIWLIRNKRLGPGSLCALALGLTLLPWLWRSYELTGEPVLTTEAGYELWNGNNERMFLYYPLQSIDVSIGANLDALSAEDREQLKQLHDNEAVEDHWFRRKALTYIRAHPWLTFTRDMRKIGATFDWLPTPRHSLAQTLVHAFSFGPVMVLGLWGMWLRRRKWREDSLIYLMFAQFLLVTAVYFGQTNHRVFLDVYWIVFGAGAIVTTAVRYKADRMPDSLPPRPNSEAVP
jgi:hypothetical protein